LPADEKAAEKPELEPADPQELLAFEARWRVPAAVLATLAGLLQLGGAIAQALVLSDNPNNSPGRLLFFHDHASTIVLTSVILGLGALSISGVLLVLYRSVKGRRPELLSAARLTAVAGPVIVCIAQIAEQVILAVKSADFATHGSQTYEEAKSILDGDVLRAAATVGLAGQLALGFTFVVISLNAMRAGLLTRFMGVLGIIVGVLFVIPLGSPLPVVQSFWLFALSFLLLGRWPGGMPKAWTTGKAEPWPSTQELRERREREAAAGNSPGRSGRGRPEPEPEPATPQGTTHPASKKRKRKRRR
jgi:hypothetical protein